jgi:signal transduction histidine kinase
LQSKLFKPFSRLHTTKQFPGIGMGLALTRKMLQRMGATVQAQGAVQAGCTVCIALPAALPGAMQVTLQDALPEAPRRA